MKKVIAIILMAAMAVQAGCLYECDSSIGALDRLF